MYSQNNTAGNVQPQSQNASDQVNRSREEDVSFQGNASYDCNNQGGMNGYSQNQGQAVSNIEQAGPNNYQAVQNSNQGFAQNQQQVFAQNQQNFEHNQRPFCNQNFNGEVSFGHSLGNCIQSQPNFYNQSNNQNFLNQNRIFNGNQGFNGQQFNNGSSFNGQQQNYGGNNQGFNDNLSFNNAHGLNGSQNCGPQDCGPYFDGPDYDEQFYNYGPHKCGPDCDYPQVNGPQDFDPYFDGPDCDEQFYNYGPHECGPDCDYPQVNGLQDCDPYFDGPDCDEQFYNDSLQGCNPNCNHPQNNGQQNFGQQFNGQQNGSQQFNGQQNFGQQFNGQQNGSQLFNSQQNFGQQFNGQQNGSQQFNGQQNFGQQFNGQQNGSQLFNSQQSVDYSQRPTRSVLNRPQGNASQANSRGNVDITNALVDQMFDLSEDEFVSKMTGFANVHQNFQSQSPFDATYEDLARAFAREQAEAHAAYREEQTQLRAQAQAKAQAQTQTKPSSSMLSNGRNIADAQHDTYEKQLVSGPKLGFASPQSVYGSFSSHQSYGHESNSFDSKQVNQPVKPTLSVPVAISVSAPMTKDVSHPEFVEQTQAHSQAEAQSKKLVQTHVLESAEEKKQVFDLHPCTESVFNALIPAECMKICTNNAWGVVLNFEVLGMQYSVPLDRNERGIYGASLRALIEQGIGKGLFTGSRKSDYGCTFYLSPRELEIYSAITVPNGLQRRALMSVAKVLRDEQLTVYIRDKRNFNQQAMKAGENFRAQLVQGIDLPQDAVHNTIGYKKSVPLCKTQLHMRSIGGGKLAFNIDCLFDVFKFTGDTRVDVLDYLQFEIGFDSLFYCPNDGDGIPAVYVPSDIVKRIVAKFQPEDSNAILRKIYDLDTGVYYNHSKAEFGYSAELARDQESVFVGLYAKDPANYVFSKGEKKVIKKLSEFDSSLATLGLKITDLPYSIVRGLISAYLFSHRDLVKNLDQVGNERHIMAFSLGFRYCPSKEVIKFESTLKNPSQLEASKKRSAKRSAAKAAKAAKEAEEKRLQEQVLAQDVAEVSVAPEVASAETQASAQESEAQTVFAQNQQDSIQAVTQVTTQTAPVESQYHAQTHENTNVDVAIANSVISTTANTEYANSLQTVESTLEVAVQSQLNLKTHKPVQIRNDVVEVDSNTANPLASALVPFGSRESFVPKVSLEAFAYRGEVEVQTPPPQSQSTSPVSQAIATQTVTVQDIHQATVAQNNQQEQAATQACSNYSQIQEQSTATQTTKTVVEKVPAFDMRRVRYAPVNVDDAFKQTDLSYQYYAKQLDASDDFVIAFIPAENGLPPVNIRYPVYEDNLVCNPEIHPLPDFGPVELQKIMFSSAPYCEQMAELFSDISCQAKIEGAKDFLLHACHLKDLNDFTLNATGEKPLTFHEVMDRCILIPEMPAYRIQLDQKLFIYIARRFEQTSLDAYVGDICKRLAFLGDAFVRDVRLLYRLAYNEGLDWAGKNFGVQTLLRLQNVSADYASQLIYRFGESVKDFSSSEHARQVLIHENYWLEIPESFFFKAKQELDKELDVSGLKHVALKQDQSMMTSEQSAVFAKPAELLIYKPWNQFFSFGQSTVSAQVESLTQNFDALNNCIADLYIKIDSLTKSKSDLEKQLTQLQEMLGSSQDHLAASQQKLNFSLQELADTKKQLADSHELICTMHEQAQEKEAKLQKTIELLHRQEQNTASLQEAFDDQSRILALVQSQSQGDEHSVYDQTAQDHSVQTHSAQAQILVSAHTPQVAQDLTAQNQSTKNLSVQNQECVYSQNVTSANSKPADAIPIDATRLNTPEDCMIHVDSYFTAVNSEPAQSSVLNVKNNSETKTQETNKAVAPLSNIKIEPHKYPDQKVQFEPKTHKTASDLLAKSITQLEQEIPEGVIMFNGSEVPQFEVYASVRPLSESAPEYAIIPRVGFNTKKRRYGEALLLTANDKVRKTDVSIHQLTTLFLYDQSADDFSTIPAVFTRLDDDLNNLGSVQGRVVAVQKTQVDDGFKCDHFAGFSRDSVGPKTNGLELTARGKAKAIMPLEIHCTCQCVYSNEPLSNFVLGTNSPYHNLNALNDPAQTAYASIVYASAPDADRLIHNRPVANIKTYSNFFDYLPEDLDFNQVHCDHIRYDFYRSVKVRYPDIAFRALTPQQFAALIVDKMPFAHQLDLVLQEIALLAYKDSILKNLEIEAQKKIRLNLVGIEQHVLHYLSGFQEHFRSHARSKTFEPFTMKESMIKPDIMTTSWRDGYHGEWTYEYLNEAFVQKYYERATTHYIVCDMDYNFVLVPSPTEKQSLEDYMSSLVPLLRFGQDFWADVRVMADLARDDSMRWVNDHPDLTIDKVLASFSLAFLSAFNSRLSAFNEALFKLPFSKERAAYFSGQSDDELFDIVRCYLEEDMSLDSRGVMSSNDVKTVASLFVDRLKQSELAAKIKKPNGSTVVPDCYIPLASPVESIDTVTAVYGTSRQLVKNTLFDVSRFSIAEGVFDMFIKSQVFFLLVSLKRLYASIFAKMDVYMNRACGYSLSGEDIINSFQYIPSWFESQVVFAKETCESSSKLPKRVYDENQEFPLKTGVCVTIPPVRPGRTACDYIGDFVNKPYQYQVDNWTYSKVYELARASYYDGFEWTRYHSTSFVDTAVESFMNHLMPLLKYHIGYFIEKSKVHDLPVGRPPYYK